ncbi:hypothetical protein V6R21_14850 [Limibacter armeniacum]|uniref:hypothetical protein n=1 Tax=Limibacter armeniacum TaxID=466084 RepID=UPI002FE5EFCE
MVFLPSRMIHTFVKHINIPLDESGMFFHLSNFIHMGLQYILFAVFAIIYTIYRLKKYKKKDLNHLIIPQLEKHGLTLVSSESPEYLSTGPFPTVEISLFIKSNYSKPIMYRKLIVLSASGQEREVWAKIEYGFSNYVAIDFKPDLETVI